MTADEFRQKAQDQMTQEECSRALQCGCEPNPCEQCSLSTFYGEALWHCPVCEHGDFELIEQDDHEALQCCRCGYTWRDSGITNLAG